MVNKGVATVQRFADICRRSRVFKALPPSKRLLFYLLLAFSDLGVIRGLT
ncbi:MAG: hypothetical protein F6J95_023200 [Leptolyngbya sp. SIO1E4]|nr:hypothetical protein [Leptolyngbya sp. SIO1E4]